MEPVSVSLDDRSHGESRSTGAPGGTILVVDDQESARSFLGRYLEGVGHDVLLAESVAVATQLLRHHAVDVVVTDLRMPEVDGLQGLRLFKSEHPNLPVIVLTAFATIETAVHAMRLGAFDYIRKPFEPEEMELIVARALEHRRLVEENKKLRDEIDGRFRLENMVGRSPAMLRVFELIRKVAPVDVPVLITGESGTGKDLVARALHGLSRRAAETFLSINCAAVPESLLESELFGHEKGAFSGAERARPGYFREADAGTLFLDEIGDMSVGQQAKLLRVLESGELIPVGAEHPIDVDVRVITATHRDLETMVEDGSFRADLLFRIDTMRIHLPPLRERREDIPLLLAAFLEHGSRWGPKTGAHHLSAPTMRLLLGYRWPGNVRELAHAVEHAALIAEGGEIRPEHLPARIREPSGAAQLPGGDWISAPYREAKRSFERAYFEGLLARTDGNVTHAAQQAGIHRATLHEKLRRLGLTRD